MVYVIINLKLMYMCFIKHYNKDLKAWLAANNI